METLKLGQKIKVGEYYCKVEIWSGGYYIKNQIGLSNENIITQFLSKQELIKKFGLPRYGQFPYCDTLEQLTEVVMYLKSFEKPQFKRGDVIFVWDEYMKKQERIFVEYIQGNEKPFVCVNIVDEIHYKTNKTFSIATWQFAEPIPQPKKITKDEIKKAFDCETFEIID